MPRAVVVEALVARAIDSMMQMESSEEEAMSAGFCLALRMGREFSKLSPEHKAVVQQAAQVLLMSLADDTRLN